MRIGEGNQAGSRRLNLRRDRCPVGLSAGMSADGEFRFLACNATEVKAGGDELAASAGFPSAVLYYNR